MLVNQLCFHGNCAHLFCILGKSRAIRSVKFERNLASILGENSLSIRRTDDGESPDLTGSAKIYTEVAYSLAVV